MATRLHVSDALTGIYVAGNATFSHLGTMLALVAVAALVAAMGISAYSGMLSIVTIIDSVRPVRSGKKVRIVTILCLALAWLVLGAALTNATTVLNDWLIVMLYLLAPWTSVSLVDFYFVRHGKFAVTDLFTPTGIYGRWGERGISAYLIGVAVEAPFMFITNVYESPGAAWLRGVDISWIVGLLVAGGIYFASTRHLDRPREALAIARSERELAGGELLR
jgi:purine-cytosine permease-like protein